MENQPSQNQPKGSNSKAGTIIASLIGIALLVLIVSALMKKDDTGDTNENWNGGVVNANTNIKASYSIVDANNELKMYRNEEYKFQLTYPKNYDTQLYTGKVPHSGNPKQYQILAISNTKFSVHDPYSGQDDVILNLDIYKDSNSEDVIQKFPDPYPISETMGRVQIQKSEIDNNGSLIKMVELKTHTGNEQLLEGVPMFFRYYFIERLNDVIGIRLDIPQYLTEKNSQLIKDFEGIIFSLKSTE